MHPEDIAILDLDKVSNVIYLVEERRLEHGTDKHHAHAANFADRLLIRVINSETKYRHTLESCRDPAEPKRTLCCYGRASTGSEGKREVSPAGIPSRQSDKSTGAADVAWRCSRILGEKVQDRR